MSEKTLIRKHKIVVAVTIWVIIGNVLSLLTWVLPYPHDVRLLVGLLRPEGIFFMNMSSLLGIGLCFYLLLLLFTEEAR